MLIHTNKEKLKELARYFYNITKTLIAIYDADLNLICAYPDSMCDFCTAVRRDGTLCANCFQDDRKAFDICRATRKTHIYHCHMGLVEVATPILCNNQIIGYMLFGQLTDRRDKTAIYEKIEQVAADFKVDREQLISACDKIRYRSKEYIESISALLEMCANYIWLNSIISVRNDGLAHSLELYIRENLSGDLSSAALCRQFNFGRSKLYDIALASFGCSLGQYIQLCRLDKAKELLVDAHLSIGEVAEQTGFKDVNYFIRFFKKHTGVTPKRYQAGEGVAYK